jgi:hypothetical protein
VSGLQPRWLPLDATYPGTTLAETPKVAIGYRRDVDRDIDPIATNVVTFRDMTTPT